MMRNTLGLFALASLTSLFSCSSSGGDAPDAAGTSKYFLNVNIDGVGYEAVSPRILAGITPAPTPRITVTSATSVGSFELLLDDHQGVANYTLGGVGDYLLSMKYAPAGASSDFASGACGGSEGTLNITKLTATEIEGTFAFVGKQVGSCATAGKNFTNGSFKSGIIQ